MIGRVISPSLPERSVLQVVQPEEGGVPQHVLHLALGLAVRGWTVEVVANEANVIRPALLDAGITVHTIAMKRLPGPGDLNAARALRALDNRGSYRLVHAHSTKAGALVRGVLPRARRLLYTPNCLPFSGEFGTAKRTMYRAVEQMLVPRSGAIVAVCDWERREAMENLRGVRSRLHTIYNGVPVPREAPPDPALREFAADGPLAGFVSRLDEQKDPLTLVRAFAHVIGDGAPPGRLAIVGNGELESEVEDEIERLGLSEHVRRFPFGGDVAPYLRAVDLFVLASRWEALPLAILEAMSCGLPIVATGVGGVPDVVHDGVTGRVVPPGEPRSLGVAMRELLLDEDLRRAMGVAAGDLAQRRLGADRMVDETAALYESLLRRAA